MARPGQPSKQGPTARQTNGSSEIVDCPCLAACQLTLRGRDWHPVSTVSLRVFLWVVKAKSLSIVSSVDGVILTMRCMHRS